MKEQCTHIGDCEDPSKCGCVTVNEVWKDIPEYEGLYQVSNLGRVKSLKYRGADKEGILKHGKTTKGYPFVNLYSNSIPRNRMVHRLVMLAFFGKSDLEVNHKNGNKTDNRLENLEYCTAKQNMRHAFDTGLASGQKGEKNYGSKLTRACVERIKYGHQGMTQAAIARIYGVLPCNISRIRSGERWTDV